MDTIGLENTIAECLTVDGVQRAIIAGERKPPVFGDTHLVALLGQGVRATAMDVTEDSDYTLAYGAYACGLALSYIVLRVPATKLGTIQQILSSNTKVEVRLPILELVIDIGREEPIPEISAGHVRALNSLKFSPEGREVIEGLYVAEAGLCGAEGSWGVLLDEYITGLQGNNPRYSPAIVKAMLQLTAATDSVVGTVLNDLRQYRSLFRD